MKGVWSYRAKGVGDVYGLMCREGVWSYIKSVGKGSQGYRELNSSKIFSGCSDNTNTLHEKDQQYYIQTPAFGINTEMYENNEVSIGRHR